MTQVFNIALTNLGAYNEGKLRFKWLSLPATEEEIEEAMKAIGIGEPCYGDESGEYGYYEEWFITDYESDFGYRIGEYANIDELNELADEIASMNDYEQNALKAYMEAYSNDLEEAIEAISKGNYVFYKDWSLLEVAEEEVEQLGLPDLALRYFDYEAYARDLGFDGYYETEYGTIYIY